MGGGKPQQSLRNVALRPVQPGQENARRLTDVVGDHRTICQFEPKGGADKLCGHLKEACIDRTGLRPRKVINAMVGAYEAWERAKRPRGSQRK
jgi:hypothetical protein